MNADFVKPAAVTLGLVADGERFGWHCFRHSLSTWVNDVTKDITIPQAMLRHSNPKMTLRYTHGTFAKGLAAQAQYMEQMVAPRRIAAADR